MSGSVLSRVRARVDSGYPTPELDDMRVLLEAVEGVIAMCDESDDSLDWWGGHVTTDDLRDALTDALEGGE